MQILRSLVLSACSWSTLVLAQSTSLGFTSVPTSIKAGQAVVLQYSAPDLIAPATITLRKGNANNLETIGTLTSSAVGGKYTWTPANSYADGSDYALQIQQGREVNYSGAISLSGGDSNAILPAYAATQLPSSSGAALTLSYSQSQSVASIESMLSSYSAALQSHSGAPNSTSACITGATSSRGAGGRGGRGSAGSTWAGTGSPLPRNTTLITPAPSTTSGGSSSVSVSASTSSQSALSATPGAAPPKGGVLTGSSPLALVLAAFVCMLL